MEYSDPALPRREPRVLWNSTEAPKAPLRGFLILMAWWQNGHAAACKAVYAGSIPTHASISPPRSVDVLRRQRAVIAAQAVHDCRGRDQDGCAYHPTPGRPPHVNGHRDFSATVALDAGGIGCQPAETVGRKLSASI
jgi:hypothetical protein